MIIHIKNPTYEYTTVPPIIIITIPTISKQVAKIIRASIWKISSIGYCNCCKFAFID